MISIEQAAARIGAGVVYRPGHGPAEDGTITSVNDRYVFVRYAGRSSSQATRPEDLTFLSQGDAA